MKIAARALTNLRSLSYARLIVVAVGIVLALALRVSLIDYRSSDFFGYTKDWYATLKVEGFSAFSHGFSNYNLPYLYLLYIVIRLLPELPAPVAVKIPSLVADFICAWFTYRIVRIKYQGSVLPMLAGLVILFAPTVILNGAFWGQADAIYTAALLATLYFMIERRPALALAAFGVAFSFKAQAVFLAPVLVIMLLRKGLPWKYAPIALLPPVLALLPAVLAGRPLLDLLLIYPSQADQYQLLSMHAPSLYAWLPDSSNIYQYFYPAGLVLAAAIAIFFIAFVQHSRAKLTPALLTELSLASVLFMPFFLPKMHERYFFPADVISIVFAAFYPEYYYVAIAMSGVSLLAYEPYLFGRELVPMAWLALILLAVLSIVMWRTVRDLFGDQRGSADLEGSPPAQPALH